MNSYCFQSEPFPHLVIDDFADAGVLRAATDEFESVPADAWVRYDSDDEHGKRACHRLDAMGLACRQLLDTLIHMPDVRIMAQQIGLDDLAGDPSLYGGGLHVTEPGGWLGIHADNERHPTTGLARRLNLIVYCTPEWQPGWGGELELWDATCTRCVRAIEPVFNRAVLFTTGPRDYHGHPHPVRSPSVARKSLAVYYWSPARTRARFVATPGEKFDAARETARIERSR